MEGIGYFVLFLCSIAFAIIVVYISILLVRVSKSLKSLGYMLESIEKQLQDITPPLKESMREANKLADDTNHKLKAFDSLVDTLENVGTSVHHINDVYQIKKKRTSDEDIFKQARPFIEGMKWSEALVQLYSQWKKKKHRSKTS